MKNFLLFLLIVPVFGFGQVILDVDNIEKKYSTVVVGYFDRYGDLLFDGEAAEHNIAEFKTNSDFDEIYTYNLTCFEGAWGKSNLAVVKFYVNGKGNPTTVKEVFFKKYDSKTDKLTSAGTSIELNRDGTIKSLNHN